METVKRRDFLRAAALASGGLALSPSMLSAAANPAAAPLTGIKTRPEVQNAWSFHFFSKHLQFLDYAGAAKACAEAGFDGADLTVRPRGHVLPEKVEKDLPDAVKAFEEAGLKIEMMVSGITDAEDPLTEKVLGTASQLGIRYYRMGYYSYEKGLSIPENLDRIKGKMEGLARLNEKHRIHGAYQNHAGSRFGAPVWDVWEVIRDMDPEWTGCQYDIRHATAEGNRSWPLGLELLQKHIRCLVIKDFRWGEQDGKSREINVPVGEGIVDFPGYFKKLKAYELRCPITIHLEYPMFPRDDMSLEEKYGTAVELMKKDLAATKSYL